MENGSEWGFKTKPLFGFLGFVIWLEVFGLF
jgi:hypothetical protein